MVITNHGLVNKTIIVNTGYKCLVRFLQQENQIMEATEGLSEATSLQSQSVVALAQLANSDRVS